MIVDFARCQFDDEEREAVNKVLRTDWLASGEQNELFEKEFAQYIGSRYAICVNSGTSANLLALSSLNLPKGSRVLTSGCGFPATLSPLLHLGLEPVLVDYDIESHNINLDQASEVIKNQHIDAVIFAHTMGNPVDMLEFVNLCFLRGIPVIEDCCEAVGAKYLGNPVGSMSTLATYSFYPAHQITAMGSGGMIVTDSEDLMQKIKSLRDWGKRWDFTDKLGDWKTDFTTDVDGITYYRGYTYDNVGYNMKLPEACAAFGRVQLKRLPYFVKRRKENYEYLLHLFKDEPIITPQICGDPSWFGFIITLYSGDRNSLAEHFEENGIRTRPFFAGNITRHEPFIEYKTFLPVADKLMRDSLFVGVWPGLNEKHLNHIKDTFSSWKETSACAF